MPSSLQFARVLALAVGASLAASAQTVPKAKPEVTKRDKDPSGESVFEGKLIDAECHGDAKCRVSAYTKEFGLILPDGTYLKFDEGGNQKVKLFLGETENGRKMLSAKPDVSKPMTVKASGTRTGDTFNLESIK